MLEMDISGYTGEFSRLIGEAPALYRLMTRLLDDSALPRAISPLVIAAIAYFILPEDIIPEEKFGPAGYVDDIYLCAFVASEVARASGGPEILARNWDGAVPIHRVPGKRDPRAGKGADRRKEAPDNAVHRLRPALAF